MSDAESNFQLPPHDHVFLGRDHEKAERRTWGVIILCSIMMIAEIIGGALFGSLALIADGLHMSTHAGALLLAALAYTYARKYANDRSFQLRHRQIRRPRRIQQRHRAGDDCAADRL